MSIRNFARLLFSPLRQGKTTNESLDSFLNSFEDAMRVRVGEGPPLVGNSKFYDMISKGHSNYTNSFKSKKRHS